MAQAALVLVGGFVLPLVAGCETVDSCEYRCTAAQNACPVGLTCDVTLGSCVSEDYTGTCDADAHEVTVCKDEPIELDLPGAAPSNPRAIDGLPESAAIEQGKLKTLFEEDTAFAFGSPDETRQYWRVDVKDDCPVVEAALPQLCVGDTLSRPLPARNGEGELSFELLEEDEDFSLSPEGVLAGKATLAGERELRVEVTDSRGLNTVRSLTVTVSDECPDVRDTLPVSCAGDQYEATIGLVGQAPVAIKDYTPIQKNGKDLTSSQAQDLARELALQVKENNGGYVLTATPSVKALGSYVLAFELENELRAEQRNVVFQVKECSEVQADFSACEGETFDFDLEGAVGDVWTFYDALDPLNDPISFVSDRRLRGALTTPGLYEILARVENAVEATNRLVTLTLAIVDSSAAACTPTTDAGSTPSDAGTTYSETSSEPAPTPDAATPPVEEVSLGEGCVGRPYEYAVPIDGVASGSWNATNLPAGLSIGAEGVISGAPEAAFSDWIEVSGSNGSGSVSHAFRLTIHAWCSVVFKGVADGSTLTHLYQADRRPDVATRDLSDDLVDDEEVTRFALSPDHEHVAFSVFDSYSNTARVVVKRRLPLGSGETESLVTGNVTTAPFSGWVSDLSWGTDRHLALIVAPVTSTPDAGADAGLTPASLTQTLHVFDVVKSGQATTAAQVLAKPTRDARDLVWMDGWPCVTLADAPAANTARESVCWRLDTGAATTGAEIFNKYETYQVRGHAGRFLQAHPFETGGIVLTSWMPNPPPGELYPQVIHEATFASPLGDLVGTVRDLGMEVARAGDPTLSDPSEGFTDYLPLGTIADCTTIDAWRAGGSLACSTGLSDPNERVTIAKPSATAVSTLTPFDAPGHATSGRRIFLDDAFYVYDDLDGELNYVDLAAAPPQVRAQTHGEGRYPVALEPVDGNRFVMQGRTAMWVGVVSSGSLGLTQVNGADNPAAFSECEPAFGWLGFDGWCGGDQISRRFQLAPDDDLGAFQTDGSNLALFSISWTRQLKRVEDIRVACGEHPYCLTEFTLAR